MDNAPLELNTFFIARTEIWDFDQSLKTENCSQISFTIQTNHKTVIVVEKTRRFLLKNSKINVRFVRYFLRGIYEVTKHKVFRSYKRIKKKENIKRKRIQIKAIEQTFPAFVYGISSWLRVGSIGQSSFVLSRSFLKFQVISQ